MNDAYRRRKLSYHKSLYISESSNTHRGKYSAYLGEQFWISCQSRWIQSRHSKCKKDIFWLLQQAEFGARLGLLSPRLGLNQVGTFLVALLLLLLFATQYLMLCQRIFKWDQGGHHENPFVFFVANANALTPCVSPSYPRNDRQIGRRKC